jgi:hypothetical protein
MLSDEREKLEKAAQINLSEPGMDKMMEQERMLSEFLTKFKPKRKLREQIRSDARGLSINKPPNIVLGSVDRRSSIVHLEKAPTAKLPQPKDSLG